MRAVILDGIVLGLGFGLLGVGLTLVYGLGGVLNLAYGAIGAVGAAAVTAAGSEATGGGASGVIEATRCGACCSTT